MKQEKPDPFDKTLIIPGVPELPEESTLILAIAPPAEASKTPSPLPRPEPHRGSGIVAWVASVVLLTGGLTWWFLRSGSSTTKSVQVPEPVADSVPPSLQPYLDAAKNGDPKAMRMLGASYTYGLGVRINKTEGAAWYRKAAEAGDATAAQELAEAGGKP